MRTLLAFLLTSVFTQSPSAALRIVVIEGEGAVNIIQQKTAVRPLVEVRDRNNVPVSGATVTFTVNGQPAAFANGATSMTVTTNTSGQAAATGFNAVREGAVQIQVQAAHQGQVASAMISQTNFATTAAAAAAGVMAGTTGAATAGTTGAAAGGGGISATTIAIVGAAVGGGAVVATQVTKSDDGGGDHYSGSFSAPYVFVNVGAASTCTFNRTMTGTVSIDLRSDGTGLARVSGTMNPTGFIGSCTPENQRNFSVPDGAVTGGPSAITFTAATADLPITKASFTGSLSGSAITGQLTIEETTQTATGGQTFGGRGTGTATVTLTK